MMLLLSLYRAPTANTKRAKMSKSFREVYENFEEMFFMRVVKLLFKFFPFFVKTRIGDLKFAMDPMDGVLFKVAYVIKKFVPSQKDVMNDFLIDTEQSFIFASLTYEDFFTHKVLHMIPRGASVVVISDRIRGLADSADGFCTEFTDYVQVQTSQGIFWVREDNLTDKVFF